MKLKRFIAVLTILLFAFSLLAGCGGTNTNTGTTSVPAGEKTEAATQASAEPVKISFMLSTAGDQAVKDAWDKALAIATDLVGSDVKVETIDLAVDVSSYMKMKAAAGDLPDVMRGDAVQTQLGIGGYVMELPKELQDMSLMPEQGIAVDGKIYNMPIGTATWSIMYNLEFFEKAGITKAPDTWNELLEDCEKLKAVGITPFMCPLKDSYATGFLLLQIFGAEVLSKNPNWTLDRYNGKVKFDCPEWRAIYERFASLMDKSKGYIDKDALSYTSAGSQEALAQGKAAMIGMPQGAIATIQQSTYHFGAFPVPNGTDANIVTVSADRGLCLRAGMDEKTLAASIKFVKAIFNPYAYKYILDLLQSPSVIKDYDYVSAAPNEYVKGILDEMAAAVKTRKTMPLYGGIGGTQWYGAWQQSYTVLAEMYAGKNWTIDEIVKSLDEEYQKGYDSEKAAAENK